MNDDHWEKIGIGLFAVFDVVLFGTIIIIGLG